MLIDEGLPPGKLVRGEDQGEDAAPAIWLGDGRATATLWDELCGAHPGTGRWPLLLDHLHGDPGRPWADGELWPEDMSDPDGHDAEAYLAGQWATYAKELGPWTGLEPGLEPGLGPAAAGRHDDPLGHASDMVDGFLAARPELRLGLVAAARPADAITVAGWSGPANYTNDVAPLSAVLRSWEERFQAYVIGVGFAELYVAVAAPPGTREEALGIAREHFAFCPDNIWQGPEDSIEDYAARILAAPMWSFWWD